jgi:hypothetical protein
MSDPRSRHDFLNAVTSDADLAVQMYDELLTMLGNAVTTARLATRGQDDWRRRFHDRDAYARLLEAELRPLRLAQMQGSDGEQEALSV